MRSFLYTVLTFWSIGSCFSAEPAAGKWKQIYRDQRLIEESIGLPDTPGFEKRIYDSNHRLAQHVSVGPKGSTVEFYEGDHLTSRIYQDETWTTIQSFDPSSLKKVKELAFTAEGATLEREFDPKTGNLLGTTSTGGFEKSSLGSLTAQGLASYVMLNGKCSLGVTLGTLRGVSTLVPGVAAFTTRPYGEKIGHLSLDYHCRVHNCTGSHYRDDDYDFWSEAGLLIPVAEIIGVPMRAIAKGVGSAWEYTSTGKVDDDVASIRWASFEGTWAILTGAYGGFKSMTFAKGTACEQEFQKLGQIIKAIEVKMLGQRSVATFLPAGANVPMQSVKIRDNSGQSSESLQDNKAKVGDAK